MPARCRYSALNSCTQNYSRGKLEQCRIAVDQILLEALAIISGVADNWCSAIKTPDTSLVKIRETLLQTLGRDPDSLQHGIICLAEVQVRSKTHREKKKDREVLPGLMEMVLDPCKESWGWNEELERGWCGEPPKPERGLCSSSS